MRSRYPLALPRPPARSPQRATLPPHARRKAHHESHDSDLIFNPGGSHESDSPNHPGFMNLTLQTSEDSWGVMGVMRRLRLEKIGSAWEKISSQRGAIHCWLETGVRHTQKGY